MRSLYLKIFLWFWLSTAIVAGVFITIGRLSDTEAQRHSDWLAFLEYSTTANGELSVNDYLSGGTEKLKARLDRLKEKTGETGGLYDADGTRLSSGPASEFADAIAKLAAASGKFEFKGDPKPGIAAIPIKTPGSGTFIFTAAGPTDRMPPSITGRTGVFLGRLFAAVLTSGLICYALARYLTAPLGRLRETANRLSDGDLTARVRGADKRKDEIGELSRDFNAMAARVESLIQSQKRLMHDVSHELRSPLARMNVAVELARREATPEVATSLDRIDHESNALNRLIGQMLAIARMDAGAATSESIPIDMEQLVRSVVEDADFEASARACHVRLTRAVSATVIGAASLLRSAIENVVRNAVRHSPSESTVHVEMELKPDHDGVNAATGRQLLIRVRDEGCGVPESELDRIFEPFYRVVDGERPVVGGDGLGLAIARRAVELHRGEIRAFNVNPRGLAVEITLRS